MLFRQVLHEDLACASYVIADGGRAAVVDPKWEITDYLALAAEHDLTIEHILETHNHADHLSGRGRLADATGATIHVSAEAGVEYEHEPLADGDVIELRNARIRALATPGHRPEHLAYVVEDTGRGGEPWIVLTGDSLFVDDVARPDLAVEPAEGARDLHASLRRLLQLPEFVEVWPGHIGGSLCGGAGMSKKPLSTLGYERRFNRYLSIEDVEDFVRELTSGGRPQPPNFERIVELNRGPLITSHPPLQPLAPNRVQQLVEAGAVLIDGRSPREYDAAHVEGSINVTMTESAVGTRTAWVVDLDDEVVTLGPSDADAGRLAELLAAVGFQKLRGYCLGGIAAWQETGLPIETTAAVDIPTLAERLRADAVVLLDVREDDEWARGHVAGSRHVPYHDLAAGVPEEIRSAATEKPLAVACSAGNRSSIATSLLKRAGIDRVEHVLDGGVPDLPEHGIELER
jgi:glyoxylase-like metal-dependent hydrolase (beta-lactamase superfamily II)/rhodanese-related sulfurtransferase